MPPKAVILGGLGFGLALGVVSAILVPMSFFAALERMGTLSVDSVFKSTSYNSIDLAYTYGEALKYNLLGVGQPHFTLPGACSVYAGLILPGPMSTTPDVPDSYYLPDAIIGLLMPTMAEFVKGEFMGCTDFNTSVPSAKCVCETVFTNPASHMDPRLPSKGIYAAKKIYDYSGNLLGEIWYASTGVGTSKPKFTETFSRSETILKFVNVYVDMELYASEDAELDEDVAGAFMMFLIFFILLVVVVLGLGCGCAYVALKPAGETKVNP